MKLVDRLIGIGRSFAPVVVGKGNSHIIARLSQTSDLHGYLREHAKKNHLGRKILMPCDDLFTLGVRNWLPLVNEMVAVLSRKDVVGSTLYQHLSSPPYSSPVRSFYCKFFVEDPADPSHGDLYTLGSVISNEHWNQNSLIRNHGVPEDGISKEEALRILEQVEAPFSERMNWEVVISTGQGVEMFSPHRKDFLEGSLEAIENVQEDALSQVYQKIDNPNQLRGYWTSNSL